MKEKFIKLKDFNGYEISNLGRIKSYNFGREIIILKTRLDSRGYERVNINYKTFRIHKLMAIAFLNHIPNKMKTVINHIDGNKRNNCITNLEIVTQKENCTICKLKYKLL